MRSTVGISGLQAGEDVNKRDGSIRSICYVPRHLSNRVGSQAVRDGF